MNDKALSPVLGFVLVVAMIVAILGTIQTMFVPTWIKSVEAKHYFSVKSEFEELVEKAVDASNNGVSIASFDLTLKYPKYPFLLTPSTASSSIVVERIGTIEVDSPILSQPLTFDLLAIKFDPNYHFLSVSEEVMILGDYFTSDGAILGESILYSGNEINLVVINMSEGTYSGNKRVVLYGNPIFTLPNQFTKVNLTLYSENCDNYGWFLDFVDSTIPGATRGACSVSFSGKLNLILVSTDGDWSVKLAEKIINESFAISNETSATPLSTSPTVYLPDSRGPPWESAAPTYYITGYTGYANQPVNVTLEWSWRGGGFTQNFVWYTLSNGYLQLPVSPPVSEEGHERQVVELNITLQFPDGSTKTYSVTFEKRIA